MLTILTVFILTSLNLWFQPENLRFEVRDCSPRTSWHAQWLSCCKLKILPVGVRGTKNIWCLSSLFSISFFCTRFESNKHGIFAITRINRPMQDNPRQSWIVDSTRWIPNFRYWFPEFLPVELGFGIRDSLSWNPDSTSKNCPEIRETGWPKMG